MTAFHLVSLWPLTDPAGWVAVGIGGDIHAEDGKVAHGSWREDHYSWPGQTNEVIDLVVATALTADVFVTPGRRENPLRDSKRMRPQPGRWLWVDVDGASSDQMAKVAELTTAGSFTVASGRGPGHRHLYVHLAELADPDTVALFNRRLVAHVGGDPSPSAINGYLRPAGSFNHKPVALAGAAPAPVVIGETSMGAGLLLDDLDRILPAVRRSGNRNRDAPTNQGKPPPRLPPEIARLLEREPEDRSEHLYAIVAACHEAGFTLGQTAAVCAICRAVVEKYRDRLDDEVGRIWEKLQPCRGEPPVAASTLAACEAVFDRWLPTGDPVPRRAVWATYAANQYPADPVWLMLVGGSGTGKTETVMSIAALAGVVAMSTLTGPAALLSGSPTKDKAAGATGGLLRMIGERGVLVLKDFTSIIGMHRDARSELLAALRECFDGHWERQSGADGGKLLGWSGHLAVVAGCTGVIDSAHAVVAAMGERFLFIRTGDGDRRKLAAAALANTGREDQMRTELAEATAGLLADLPGTPPADLDESQKGRLLDLVELATRARSPVEYDRNGNLDLVLDSEAPTRMVKELARLWQGCSAIGLDDTGAWAVVERAGLDSIPKLRRAVIDHLRTLTEPASTETVGEAVNHPSRSTRRALEELEAHGVVIRSVAGRAHRWSLAGWVP